MQGNLYMLQVERPETNELTWQLQELQKEPTRPAGSRRKGLRLEQRWGTGSDRERKMAALLPLTTGQGLSAHRPRATLLTLLHYLEGLFVGTLPSSENAEPGLHPLLQLTPP